MTKIKFLLLCSSLFVFCACSSTSTANKSVSNQGDAILIFNNGISQVEKDEQGVKRVQLVTVSEENCDRGKRIASFRDMFAASKKSINAIGGSSIKYNISTRFAYIDDPTFYFITSTGNGRVRTYYGYCDVDFQFTPQKGRTYSIISKAVTTGNCPTSIVDTATNEAPEDIVWSNNNCSTEDRF